jgi:hypothetical protein
MTAAAGGAELVTGWKRSATWRVRGGVEEFEQLTILIQPIHRRDRLVNDGSCRWRRAGDGLEKVGDLACARWS